MKRPGDHTPEPPGGRAAERLRLFEGARDPSTEETAEGLVRQPAGKAKRAKPAKKRSSQHAKQARRKN
jgi:hypothetical protein